MGDEAECVCACCDSRTTGVTRFYGFNDTPPHRIGDRPSNSAGGGAILAPGKRAVTQTLRVMGLADQPGFGRYHEVLNRALWDARDVARRLLVVVGDDVAGPIRRPALGATVPDCAGAVAALERGARKAAQSAGRLGKTGDFAESRA